MIHFELSDRWTWRFHMPRVRHMVGGGRIVWWSWLFFAVRLRDKTCRDKMKGRLPCRL